MSRSNKTNYGKGYKSHPLYKTHCNMISRCYSKTHPDYHHYGGRGIAVCAEWMGDFGFECFVRDMGERPENMSLDRIDNNGDYEPSNCRWTTQQEQVTNQRIRKDNKTGVKGVYWRERDSRWVAQARRHKKTIHLGYFKTFDEAKNARLNYDAGVKL